MVYFLTGDCSQNSFLNGNRAQDRQVNPTLTADQTQVTVKTRPRYGVVATSISQASTIRKATIRPKTGVWNLSLTEANLAGINLSNDHANKSLVVISQLIGINVNAAAIIAIISKTTAAGLFASIYGIEIVTTPPPNRGVDSFSGAKVSVNVSAISGSRPAIPCSNSITTTTLSMSINPGITIEWFMYENGVFYISTYEKALKVRNIER
jgi:hypothetical protein